MHSCGSGVRMPSNQLPGSEIHTPSWSWWAPLCLLATNHVKMTVIHLIRLCQCMTESILPAADSRVHMAAGVWGQRGGVQAECEGRVAPSAGSPCGSTGGSSGMDYCVRKAFYHRRPVQRAQQGKPLSSQTMRTQFMARLLNRSSHKKHDLHKVA